MVLWNDFVITSMQGQILVGDCPLKVRHWCLQIDSQWKYYSLTVIVIIFKVPILCKLCDSSEQGEGPERLGLVMDWRVILSLSWEYSSEQVGVNDSLTALFKMTKSILPYWSVIVLSFSRHLQTLPSLFHSSITPLPATPYWSSLVIGWAVIWDGHWQMSANCYSFSLFLSSPGWWCHNPCDRAGKRPIAMECWPE